MDNSDNTEGTAQLSVALKETMITASELGRLHGRMDSLMNDINQNAEHCIRLDEILRGGQGRDGVLLRMAALERSVRTVTHLAGAVFVLVLANVTIMIIKSNLL